MSTHHPFHQGELAVQEKAKVGERARNVGRGISKQIPAGALQFIEQQSLLAIGSVDVDGRVWASALFGRPGFLHAIDAQTLGIDLLKAVPAGDDPLWNNLATNRQVGMVIIDLASRRRLRINGRLRETGETYFMVDVEQAYANCPKYIQRRLIKNMSTPTDSASEPIKHGRDLCAEQKQIIESADTFFVSSAHPQHGVDASHRGGQPGFVHVTGDAQLRIPDYAGNNMFNTLGNFFAYPNAGLAFIDFSNNRLLQLTGKVDIIWQRDDHDHNTGGTERYWQFNIESWRESRLPLRIEWELLEFSPHNPE
jgi:hypothetical protein